MVAAIGTAQKTQTFAKIILYDLGLDQFSMMQVNRLQACELRVGGYSSTPEQCRKHKLLLTLYSIDLLDLDQFSIMQVEYST